jgi:predicted lipoprotein with Yx(FWY)xxD motif
MNSQRKVVIGVIGALIVAAVVATGAMALSGSSSASKSVVKTGHAIGKKVLVTRARMTLYSLSAETHGRFICKDKTCLSVWHPLVVGRGTKPTGASHLATVRRPDGRTQVTFSGKPLYTFAEDKKSGQAKGEGFKDVGTWHVAAVGATSKTAPAQPMNQSPSGYGTY